MKRPIHSTKQNAAAPITTEQWLQEATLQLIAAGIETARLDAIILLGDALGKDKSWLLAYPEYELQRSQIDILNTKVTQRADHTPLAYIRGQVEFYGRTFMVDRNVLVPRPETESIIELLIKMPAGKQQMKIIDVGTGSGCLAISAKLELPLTEVIGTDIDQNCLNTARKNARALGADIKLLCGDLLSPLPKTGSSQPTTILANLPYIPSGYPVNKAAGHEPELALFSGDEGLDHFRKLFMQLTTFVHKPLHIITESLPDQHQQLAQLASRSGYEQTSEQNYVQLFTIAASRNDFTPANK